MRFLLFVFATASFINPLNSFANVRWNNFKTKHYQFKASSINLSKIVKQSKRISSEIVRLNHEMRRIDNVLRQDKAVMARLEHKMHQNNFKLSQLRSSVNMIKRNISKIDEAFRNYKFSTQENIKLIRKEAVYYKNLLMELLSKTSVQEKKYEQYRKSAIRWEDEFRRRRSALSYCRRIPNSYCQAEVSEMNFANREMSHHRDIRDRAKRLVNQYDRDYYRFRDNSRKAQRREKNEIPVLQANLEQKHRQYENLRRELPPRLREAQRIYKNQRSVVFKTEFAALKIEETKLRKRKKEVLISQHLEKYGNLENVRKLNNWINNSKSQLTSLFENSTKWEKTASTELCQSNNQSSGKIICPEIKSMLDISKFIKSEVAEAKTYNMYDFCKKFPEHHFVKGRSYNASKVTDTCLPVTFRYLVDTTFHVKKDFSLDHEDFLSLVDNMPKLKFLGFEAQSPKESLELLERYKGKIKGLLLSDSNRKTNDFVGKNCEVFEELDYIISLTLRADDSDSLSCTKKFPNLKRLTVGTGSDQFINLKKVQFPPNLESLRVFSKIKKNIGWLKRLPQSLTNLNLMYNVTQGLIGKWRKYKLQKFCQKRELEGKYCLVYGL